MKKTNVIAVCLLFLLVGIVIGETDVSETTGVFWSRIDGTLVLTNETENVNIGENATTDYRLKVNGTSYFNDTMIVNNRVGIGTNPDSAFHIKASVSGIVGSHSAGQLIIQNPANSVFANAVITGYESDGDGNPEQQLWYLGSVSGSNSEIIFLNRRNSKLHLGTSGTSRLTILGNGNVGVGTNNPNSKLHVVGDVNISGILNVTETINTNLSQYAGDNIIWDGVNNEFDVSPTNDNGYWSLNNTEISLTNDTHIINLTNDFMITTEQNVSVGGDWLYYLTLTIESDFINTSLTNFPILVSIPDATGDKCKANGEDIRFYLPDNTTQLNHEIVKWDDNSDRLVWVNVTTIDSNTDTVFLMHYGNADATDNQNVNGVWNENFVGVYHFNENTGNCLDSTVNENHGDGVYGTPAYEQTGIVGYGVTLDGTEGFDIPNDFGIFLSTDFTIESWLEIDALVVNDQIIYPKGEVNLGLYVSATEDIRLAYYDGVWQGIDIKVNPDTTDWHYYVASYDNNVNMYGYYDGNYAGASSDSGNIASVSADSNFGYGTGQGFEGSIDEIRISDIVRSNSWINATYHTSTQTNGFLTFGSEQDLLSGWEIQTVDMFKVNTSTNLIVIDATFILPTITTGDSLTDYEVKGSILLNETTNLIGTYTTSWKWR